MRWGWTSRGAARLPLSTRRWSTSGSSPTTSPAMSIGEGYGEPSPSLDSKPMLLLTSQAKDTLGTSPRTTRRQERSVMRSWNCSLQRRPMPSPMWRSSGRTQRSPALEPTQASCAALRTSGAQGSTGPSTSCTPMSCPCDTSEKPDGSTSGLVFVEFVEAFLLDKIVYS